MGIRTTLIFKLLLSNFIHTTGSYSRHRAASLGTREFYNQRKKMRIDVDGSVNTITIHPDEGQHSATVILMHGLGDSADGWRDVAEQWATAFPYMKFILPTAPSMPVTLNGGMPMPAWYDIVGLTDRANELCEGIDSSCGTVRRFMESEAALGIPYNRMALAGFSQGGAMSLYCGLQLPVEQKPAGLLCLSGYLPGASSFKLTPGLEDVPVLHCHGSADPVVRFDWAQKTKDHLLSTGAASYELKVYRGLQHSCNMEEIRDAAQFLGTILPYNAELALPPRDPATLSIKELKAAIRHAGLGAQATGFTEKQEFVSLLASHYASLRK